MNIDVHCVITHNRIDNRWPQKFVNTFVTIIILSNSSLCSKFPFQIAAQQSQFKINVIRSWRYFFSTCLCIFSLAKHFRCLNRYFFDGWKTFFHSKQKCRFSCCELRDKLHLIIIICQNKSMSFDTVQSTYSWKLIETERFCKKRIKLEFPSASISK